MSSAVLALGFTLLGPTPPANASGASTFHLKSAVTGKCLQWNGVNKNITLATCKNKMSQYWGHEGAQIANYENPLGGYCLGISRNLEKPPVGRHCSDAPSTRANDLRYNHKTYLVAAPETGYHPCNFKTVSSKVVCGRRTSTLKPMQWIVKP